MKPAKINHNPTMADYNALIDYIQSLEVTVGQGLEKRQSGAGTIITAGGSLIVPVVTDVNYNTTTHVLKQTKRSVMVNSAQAAVDTTIDTAEPC
jgi:hypothetical protein